MFPGKKFKKEKNDEKSKNQQQINSQQKNYCSPAW
jgi:hypothetical protein